MRKSKFYSRERTSKIEHVFDKHPLNNENNCSRRSKISHPSIIRPSVKRICPENYFPKNEIYSILPHIDSNSDFQSKLCPKSLQTPSRRMAPLDLKPQPSTQHRSCNCKRSNCLKLYCDCFANGKYCSDCNCIDCFNDYEHESYRGPAIQGILDRNPNAFRPKIASIHPSPSFANSKPSTHKMHSKVRIN